MTTTEAAPVEADEWDQYADDPRVTPAVLERLRTRVRRVDARDAIKRLETFVGRMERRYEYTSEEMTERVRSGQQKCTREISLWLMRHRDLVDLRQAVADAGGTPTTTTG